MLAAGPGPVGGVPAGLLPHRAGSWGWPVCALITLFGNRAEAFAWASVNMVLVLAGIYYPISVLPRPVAVIADAIPLTYFLDAYRAHFGFPSEFTAPITTGLALSAVYAVLAMGLLRGGPARPADRAAAQDVGVRTPGL